MRLPWISTAPASGGKLTARGAAVIVIVMIALLTGWQCRSSWEIANAQAERLVAALAKALDYQTDGSLRTTDSLLANAIDRIDPAHWPDTDQVDWFRGQMATLPESRNLLVVGADGHSIGPGLSASGWAGQSVDVSDREFFRYHRDHPGDRGMHVSDPVVGRTEGHPVVPLSRAIIDSDGHLRGVMAISLDPKILAQSLRSLEIEDGGGISIIRRDGIFLARLPELDGSLGRSTAASALFREYIPAKPKGIGHFTSVTDGNDKIVAYRTLDRYPVVVTVGITRDTAFAAWRLELVRDLISVGLFSLLLLILATLLDRRELARASLAAQLAARNRDMEQQVADRTRHLKEAQLEAERWAAALAASNADLEQFAYVASHDLQEPLRTVASYVQLLERRYGDKLDGDAADFIKFAVDGTHRMHDLIIDLLAYSRVGGKVVAFVATPMERVLLQATKNLSVAIHECGAVISHGPLPILDVDESQMVEVLQNLIGNAIKYRRPEVAPVLRIEATRSERDWTFAVRDNGLGIEPEYWPRIFMIFQRLHTRDQYEGNGIGLAVCKRTVERHGGRIWLDSIPGEGSTFFFSLPASR